MAGKLPTAEAFEGLWVWQPSRQLVKHANVDFGEGAPAERDSFFRSQIQRAAVSIMNNIAEGFERRTDPEFARFLDTAKGSSAEVRSMYCTAEDLKYLSTEVAAERRERARQPSAAS